MLLARSTTSPAAGIRGARHSPERGSSVASVCTTHTAVVSGESPDREQTIEVLWLALNRLRLRHDEQRLLRGEPAVTNKEIADAAGVADSTLGDWLNKRAVVPDWLKFSKMVKFLGGDPKEWVPRWKQAMKAYQDKPLRRAAGASAGAKDVPPVTTQSTAAANPAEESRDTSTTDEASTPTALQAPNADSLDDPGKDSLAAADPAEASRQRGAAPIHDSSEPSSLTGIQHVDTSAGGSAARSAVTLTAVAKLLRSHRKMAIGVSLAVLVVLVSLTATSMSKSPSTFLAAPATPTPASSTAAPPPEEAVDVRILEPRRENVNNRRFTASGTATLPKGTKLWLVVQAPDGAYYITNGVKPMEIDEDRTWSGEVGLGEEKNSYDVHAVATRADNPFEATVRAAVEASEKAGESLHTVRFDTLPPDAVRAASVRVQLT